MQLVTQQHYPDAVDLNEWVSKDDDGAAAAAVDAVDAAMDRCVTAATPDAKDAARVGLLAAYDRLSDACCKSIV